MLDRRTFLIGVSTAALMAHPAARALASEPAVDTNMQILANVVKDFLELIDLFGGPDNHRGKLRAWYHEWSGLESAALEAKILETVRWIYTFSVFAELKEGEGSILEGNGQMRTYAQVCFVTHFPMDLQSSGNIQTFRAFASFAPAHLL